MSRPDEVAVEQLMAGRRRRSDAHHADVAEAVRRMHERGDSTTAIAAKLKTRHGAITRILREVTA